MCVAGSAGAAASVTVGASSDRKCERKACCTAELCSALLAEFSAERIGDVEGDVAVEPIDSAVLLVSVLCVLAVFVRRPGEILFIINDSRVCSYLE